MAADRRRVALQMVPSEMGGDGLDGPYPNSEYFAINATVHFANNTSYAFLLMDRGRDVSTVDAANFTEDTFRMLDAHVRRSGNITGRDEVRLSYATETSFGTVPPGPYPGDNVGHLINRITADGIRTLEIRSDR